MSLALGSINSALTNNRLSGATRINSAGDMVGVDFVTTTAVATSTGSKSYTIGTNRDWSAGQAVVITPTDGTANISMTGTVTSYNSDTGNLVVNIASTGSDTTTTKTDWRIGYAGPRLDHDFAAPYQRIGMRSEETHTNSIKNGDGIGATTGTLGGVGVLPTNWTFPITGGLSLDITAGQNERGINGVYLRFYGTTSSTAALLRFDSLTAITHTPGDLWSQSLYSRVVSGNATNISSINMSLEECDNASTVQLQTLTPFTPTATLQRFTQNTITTSGTGTSTSRLVHGIQLAFSSGVAVDITMFVAAVQLGRMRAVANSGTAQAGGASTITLAAGASGTNSTYDNHAVVIRSGTGAGQTRTITGYVGATKVATVGIAWGTAPNATSVYSVYRTETIPNGTYSYVPTRSVAATKSADNFLAANFATFFNGLSETEGTLYVEGVVAPWLDTTLSASPRIFSLNNGTSQNDHRIYRSVATNQIVGHTIVANSNQTTFTSDVSIADAATFNASMSYKKNLFKWCYNGGAISTDTAGNVPTGIVQLVIGAALPTSTTSSNWNGWVKNLRFFPRAFNDSEHLLLHSGGL